jgi:hypothetical protein
LLERKPFPLQPLLLLEHLHALGELARLFILAPDLLKHPWRYRPTGQAQASGKITEPGH